LVVACSEEQVLNASGQSHNPVMRIQIEPHGDLKATPKSLSGRGVGSTSWKSWISSTDPAIATSKSGRMTIACTSSLFDEIGDQWELILFCAAPSQGWQRKHHDLARSAQSRQ
jgi:hypothetical protein